MMTDLLSGLFLIVGAAFIFIAALGAVRFPDFYTRMHAVSKATTLGLGCMLVGVAIALPSLGLAAKVLAVVLFLFLTTPVAAHMIGRAAHLCKVPLWKGTVADEFTGCDRAAENEAAERKRTNP